MHRALGMGRTFTKLDLHYDFVCKIYSECRNQQYNIIHLDFTASNASLVSISTSFGDQN